MREVFKDKVVSVYVVPNLNMMQDSINKRRILRKKYTEAREHNKLKSKRAKITKGKKCLCFGKQVDAEDYHREKKSRTNRLIKKIKASEYRSSGIAFVTFSNMKTARTAKTEFSEFQKLPNQFWNKYLHIEAWEIYQAPSRSNIIWANQRYSSSDRNYRRLGIHLLLFVVCLAITLPIALLDKIVPIKLK